MTFRKIASLALAMLMLCSMLCACTDSQTDSKPGTSSVTQPSSTTSQNKKTLYQVTVYGADGQPATSGVVVRFLQNGEQAALQTMNAFGVAEKELDKGNYTVELMFTNTQTKYYYDTSDMTLTETKTQLTIHLCLEQDMNGETVYDPEGEYTAYPLATGNTFVTLKPGRNYFLYVPSEAGEYQMYTADSTYKTGYYGGVHYIMTNDVGKEGPNNGTAISISASMVSPNNSFVIGVDNPGTEDVKTILYVVRVSDYIDTSIPKEIYKTTHTLTPWTLPVGAKINKFDIAAKVPYKLVLDEETGFYHLNSVDGPLVVVFLGKNASTYLDYLVPYETILENSGISATFKNEDGTYSKREIYTDCLTDYIGVFDPELKNEDGSTGGYVGGCIDHNSGLYPLTEDLMYIFQQYGRCSGWWDSASGSYIFEGITVNEENAWLFMCGYLK